MNQTKVDPYAGDALAKTSWGHWTAKLILSLSTGTVAYKPNNDLFLLVRCHFNSSDSSPTTYIQIDRLAPHDLNILSHAS